MRVRAWAKKTAILLLVVLLGGMVTSGLWIYREVNKPHAHGRAEAIITIEPRTNTGAIIAQLQREGILARAWPVWLWLKFGARHQKLKAGDYQFKSPISPLEVVNQLVQGKVVTREFTIPEGYNQFDIARVLASLPGLKQLPPEKPEDLLWLMKKTELIADLAPEARTLEGFLFPDTYEYTARTTREQLIEAMVRRFRRVYTPEMQQRARQLNLTTYQVVTLASLIEKEAKVDAERELISSVYHRRLKLGMKLECDPTVIYAALLEGRYRGEIYQSDLKRDSPYNTYQRLGLPPGPIASPGQRSLEAALNPAETNYLYFVVDATRNDGSHKFSATAADHGRAVIALRRWERESQKH